jgi:hypothetical protein
LALPFLFLKIVYAIFLILIESDREVRLRSSAVVALEDILELDHPDRHETDDPSEMPRLCIAAHCHSTLIRMLHF